VTVGVADLERALATWIGTFGFMIAGRREGADEGLAALWSLDPDDIHEQALLFAPGRNDAGLHLVSFRNAGPPVRRNAAVSDRLPKNLDVYALDIPAQQTRLSDQGYSFHDDWSESRTGELRFRETHMSGHDDTNIVFIELLDEDLHYSEQGFCGLGTVVTITSDANAETAFWREILELESVMTLVLSGPEIERMIGLPGGSGVDVRILGAAGSLFGRMEVIEYQGLDGRDRYPHARPPALGTLHVTYRLPALQPVMQRLEANNIAFAAHGQLDTLYGRGPMISFHSPAGLRVEIQGDR